MCAGGGRFTPWVCSLSGFNHEGTEILAEDARWPNELNACLGGLFNCAVIVLYGLGLEFELKFSPTGAPMFSTGTGLVLNECKLLTLLLIL